MPYLPLDENTYSPAHAFFEIRVDTVANFLATLPAHSLGPDPEFRIAKSSQTFFQNLSAFIPGPSYRAAEKIVLGANRISRLNVGWLCRSLLLSFLHL